MGKWIKNTHTDTHTHVYIHIYVHNGIYVHIYKHTHKYNGIEFSHEKEGNLVICKNMYRLNEGNN